MRFQGFPSDKGGVIVLDTSTGQVVYVDVDKTPSIIYDPCIISDNNVNVTNYQYLRKGDLSAEINPKTDFLQQNNYSTFDNEVISTYPYPIAKPWLDFINEKDPREKCRLLVDSCFTNILKMWALQIASEYFINENVKDHLVNQTLIRDLARPLISAWNLMIQRTLPVLIDSGINLFSPELAETYELLETKCKNKLELQVKVEDNDGNIKTKKVLLSKIQAMIKYRNTLAHGFKLQTEKAHDDLKIYLPIMNEILESSRFMTRYSLYSIQDRLEDNSFRCLRLMGAKPSDKTEIFKSLEFESDISPIFLCNDYNKKMLPLFHFFEIEKNETEKDAIPGLGRDIFLFEGNTNSSVIYVSSTSGQQHEKQKRMKLWQKLLKGKELEVVPMNSNNITIEMLFATSSRLSNLTLNKLIEGGKYNRGVIAERFDFESKLMQLETGDYNGLLIGGESGIGKTTLLASKVDQWLNNKDIIIFYRASILKDSEISSIILKDLGLIGVYFEQFLQMVNDIIIKAEKKLRIVIDAINEFPCDISALCANIDGIVSQCSDYSWCKIVVSVRTSSWERIPKNSRLGSSSGSKWVLEEIKADSNNNKSPLNVLQPIPVSMLRDIYERYRNFRISDLDDTEGDGVAYYRPINSYDELDHSRSTCAMMRNPLMMRLIMSAFNRKALPSDLSYNQAMKLYLDYVVLDKDNPDGIFPERINFLKYLVKEMDKICIRQISSG